MLPQIAPAIADALAQARLVTISERRHGGAPETTTNNITSVIQTVLAAQLVSRGLVDVGHCDGRSAGADRGRGEVAELSSESGDGEEINQEVIRAPSDVTNPAQRASVAIADP